MGMATTFISINCLYTCNHILEKESKVTLKSLIHQERRFIVRLRMWYAELRGHKGKRWDYEPSEHYFGRHPHKHNDKHR